MELDWKICNIIENIRDYLASCKYSIIPISKPVMKAPNSKNNNWFSMPAYRENVTASRLLQHVIDLTWCESYYPGHPN